MEVNHTLCGSLNQTQLRMISLSMAIGGGLGVILTAAILLGLLLARAYKTVLQRLFLWTVLTVLIHLSIHTSTIEHYFSYASATQDQVCSALGFIHNLIGWCEYIFYTDMIFYLLFVVHIQVRGRPYRFTQRKCVRVALECAVVLLSILTPLSIVWVPYYQQNYGSDEGICWLKAFNKDCSEVSWQYTLLYGYSALETAGLLAICICIGMLIVYCTLTVTIRPAKHIILRVLVLLIAVIMNVVLLNFLVIVGAVVAVGNYHLKIAFALIATMTDCSFMIGYLLAFYASSFKINKLIKIKKPQEPLSHQEYNSMRYKTFRKSEENSLPSSTHFDVEYTGDFTSILSDSQ